jgi:hypothetical protein
LWSISSAFSLVPFSALHLKRQRILKVFGYGGERTLMTGKTTRSQFTQLWRLLRQHVLP